MSNVYTGVVEAALRKSQLLLAVSGDQSPLLAEGLQEAVLVQLWRAYRAYLAEWAHQLGVGDTPGCARELYQLAAAKGVVSMELEELLSLREDGWLGAMSATWERLWQLAGAAAPKPPARRAQAALIPLRELGGSGQHLSWEALHDWRRALMELIRRQRALGQEW